MHVHSSTSYEGQVLTIWIQKKKIIEQIFWENIYASFTFYGIELRILGRLKKVSTYFSPSCTVSISWWKKYINTCFLLWSNTQTFPHLHVSSFLDNQILIKLHVNIIKELINTCYSMKSSNYSVFSLNNCQSVKTRFSLWILCSSFMIHTASRSSQVSVLAGVSISRKRWVTKCLHCSSGATLSILMLGKYLSLHLPLLFPWMHNH